MDKNKLIGITLLSIIFLVYTHFSDQRTSVNQVVNTTTTPTPSNSASPIVDNSLPPNALPENTHQVAQAGLFTKSMQGNAVDVTLENEDVQITLTAKGATIRSVVLKKYKDHQGEPLQLLGATTSEMGFAFQHQGIPLHTKLFFFELESDQTANHAAEQEKAGKVSFRLALGENQYLRQTFILPTQGYALQQHWEFVGAEHYIDDGKVAFLWQNHIQRVEKDIIACRNKTTVNYYLNNRQFKHLNEQSDKQEIQKITQPVKWLAFKQRFFTAGIAAEDPFETGQVMLKPATETEKIVKEASMQLQLPNLVDSKKQQGVFNYYFGPNIYKTLDQFLPGFSKNLPLGWPVVKWINQWVMIPIFGFIEKYVSNYGMVILLLVLIIKLILFPLSYKSYISMAEMKILKPTLDKLKAKHGKDLQSIQMEQVKLYKEMGINPLSGCIPVLLQMPILLAMFNFFPNAIELRQKSFLWASDLSTYDSIMNLPFSIPFYGDHVSLFTLLMTASTILYTWSSNQLNTQEGPMKVMSYLLPVSFMFILNSFPAGLSFYYFVSNIITFGQQTLIKHFVDETKIKQKLEQNRLKVMNKEVTFKNRLSNLLKASVNKKK